MMRWFRHPHETHLSEYVEGSLSPDERRRLADHLADCTRCRNRVRFIRELRTALRELPTPSPRPSLFEEIWERREAGERRILPVAPPAPPSGRRSWLAAAAVILVLLGAAAGYLLLAADEVAAGASELTARPAAPAGWLPEDRRAGVAYRWSLGYESAGWLSDAPHVRVRALYRLVGDPPFEEAPRPRLADAVLERDGDRFEGEITLPPMTAYALLAVETLDGRRHDPGRNGEPWELLVPAPDGRPTYSALRQKLEVEQYLVESGWRRVDELIEVARRLTELYPFRPLGWFNRYSYEALVADSASRDSLHAIHRVELQRLDAHLRAGADYEAEDLAALLDYADALGANEIASRAGARLERMAPDHPTLVRRRIGELYSAHAGQPVRLLDELEAAWRAGRASGAFALQVGTMVAHQLGAGEEVERWTDRTATVLRPAERDGMVLELLRYPSIAEAARERLRERIRWNADPPDDVRLPVVSRQEFEAAATRRLGTLLAAHGGSLLESGSVAAAIDSLRRALELGWDPDAAETLARAYDREGSAGRSNSLRALLAADPLRAAEAEGQAGAGASQRPGADAAAADLLGRVAHGARIASLPDSAIAAAAPGGLGLSGAERDLRDVELGIVALWQVPPAPSDPPVWETMGEWRERLAETGVEALVLLTPSWAYEADTVRDRTGWSPLVDAEGRILPRVGAGWVRQYAVLDDGRAFVHGDVSTALRHALLLARERP